MHPAGEDAAQEPPEGPPDHAVVRLNRINTELDTMKAATTSWLTIETDASTEKLLDYFRLLNNTMTALSNSVSSTIQTIGAVETETNLQEIETQFGHLKGVYEKFTGLAGALLSYGRAHDEW